MFWKVSLALFLGILVGIVLGSRLFLGIQNDLALHEGALHLVHNTHICIKKEAAVEIARIYNKHGPKVADGAFSVLAEEGLCNLTPLMELRIGDLVVDGPHVRVIRIKSLIAETGQSPRDELEPPDEWFLITESSWKPWRWWMVLFPDIL